MLFHRIGAFRSTKKLMQDLRTVMLEHLNLLNYNLDASDNKLMFQCCAVAFHMNDTLHLQKNSKDTTSIKFCMRFALLVDTHLVLMIFECL